MTTGDFSNLINLVPSLLGPSDSGHISHQKVDDAVRSVMAESNSKYFTYLFFIIGSFDLFFKFSLLQVFCVGISSLQLFIQRNWVGMANPETKETDNLTLDADTSKHLVLDGECFFPTVKSLPYLLIAKCILHDFRDCFTSFKVFFIFFRNICPIHCVLNFCYKINFN